MSENTKNGEQNMAAAKPVGSGAKEMASAANTPNRPVGSFDPKQLEQAKTFLSQVLGAQTAGGNRTTAQTTEGTLAMATKAIEVVSNECTKNREDAYWFRDQMERARAMEQFRQSDRSFFNRVLEVAEIYFPGEVDSIDRDDHLIHTLAKLFGELQERREDPVRVSEGQWVSKSNGGVKAAG